MNMPFVDYINGENKVYTIKKEDLCVGFVNNKCILCNNETCGFKHARMTNSYIRVINGDDVGRCRI